MIRKEAAVTHITEDWGMCGILWFAHNPVLFVCRQDHRAVSFCASLHLMVTEWPCLMLVLCEIDNNKGLL